MSRNLLIIYSIGILLLSVYCSFIHLMLFREKLEFLPLMLISTYSAVGVLGSWLWVLYIYFGSKGKRRSTKTH